MLKNQLKRFVIPFVLFFVLWAVLVSARVDALLMGIMAAVTGAWISLILKSSPILINLGGVARFIPFFITQSLEGGLDVARRALHPSMPIAPGLIKYQVRLPHGAALVFFSCMISLLPGTLTSKIDGDCLVIHALDVNQPLQQKLRLLEDIVARMFSMDIR